jgi:hypothetical protein
MRHMDKAYRPEIADELEHTRENLMHDQLSSARKHLGIIKREIDQVTWMPTLDDLHKFAADRSRNRKIDRKGLVADLKQIGRAHV